MQPQMSCSFFPLPPSLPPWHCCCASFEVWMRPIVPGLVRKVSTLTLSTSFKETLEVLCVQRYGNCAGNRGRAIIHSTIIKRLLLFSLFGLPVSDFGACTSIHNHSGDRPERLIRKSTIQIISLQSTSVLFYSWININKPLCKHWGLKNKNKFGLTGWIVHRGMGQG